MRRPALVATALLLAACSKTDAPPPADAAAAPRAAISLADVAGQWQVTVAPEQADTALLTYTMTATADTAGWTITFPGRDPIPLRILHVAGDSIVSEAGPYSSALRPDVPVSVSVVSRMRNDSVLVSRIVAHYQTTGADSVVHLRARGTRVP